MFPTQTRLFKEIECPSIKQRKICQLPHCIFTHARPKPKAAPAGSKKIADNIPVAVKRLNEQAPASAPPPKRDFVFAPAMLDTPPAQHGIRVRYLSVIRDKLQEAGCKNPEVRAIELEKSTAERSTAGTYPNNIRTTVREILRGEHNEGAQEAKYKAAAKDRELIYRKELANLILPEAVLAKRYTMEIPEPVLDEEESATLTCDRCKARFAFSDTNNLECHFHLLRRNYNFEKKRLEDFYPCCGQTLGESNGCEIRQTHVHKLSGASSLHRAIPFRAVPSTPVSKDWLFGAAIDCEMAYTTKGMELIRVTIIDWDTAKIVLDRTVFPFGELLDLNTRFSGISDINEGTTLDGVHYPTLGFDEVLNEVFRFVGPHSILIGHGLENDLQAMRLVHRLVVDTAILYPRHHTRTHSLKQLAWTYLSRNIQSGEHDSYEDALAAMDIVKADIANRLRLS